MKNIRLVRWFGGKYCDLDFILKYFPLDARHFVDVFGGSAAVIMNAGPYQRETYNDIDPAMVNLFRVVKDSPLELKRLLDLTPYSREEIILASDYLDDDSPLERARKTYIRCNQSIRGKVHSVDFSAWSWDKDRTASRVSECLSRWLNHLDRISLSSQRFKRIEIENKPAIEIINKYDSGDVLFYIDPPYVSDVRLDTGKAIYGSYEMDDDDHKQLAEFLGKINGRVVVSGHDCDLYNEIYSRFRRIDGPVKYKPASKKPRHESIWMNF